MGSNDVIGCIRILVYLAARWRRKINRRNDTEYVSLKIIELDAAASQFNCRFYQPCHWHAAQIMMNLKQATNSTGCGDCTQADMKFLFRRAEISQDGIKIDIRCGTSLTRCLGEEVVHYRTGVINMGEQKATTGKGAQHRFSDTGGKVRGNHCVKGITAFMQNGFGCLDGGGMSGGDYTASLTHTCLPSI